MVSMIMIMWYILLEDVLQYYKMFPMNTIDDE